jgi:nucleosome binding factor SPN SPT16 subunit
MKTVNEDTYGFYVEGGWTFLTGGGEDGSDSESSDGSEFGDSGADDSDGESSDSGSESDCKSTHAVMSALKLTRIVDDDDDGSDASGSFAEDESGEDWDELERKAARGKSIILHVRHTELTVQPTTSSR